MAVYVDDLRPTTPSRRWRYTFACHMTADTPEELAEMGIRIGLRAEWWQNSGDCTEHFDLTPGARALAVRAGAVEISWRDAARRVMRCRDARRTRFKAPTGGDGGEDG